MGAFQISFLEWFRGLGDKRETRQSKKLPRETTQPLSPQQLSPQPSFPQPKAHQKRAPVTDRGIAHTPGSCGDRPCQLRSIWIAIREEYFPHRADLDSYDVQWSPRAQKRTLASCNIERKRVIVARELRHSEHHEWLEPLLYHEMCHAVLGRSVMRPGRRSEWHGPHFRRLEQRHPKMLEFDVWVKQGGWAKAVRSDRSRRAWQRRKQPFDRTQQL